MDRRQGLELAEKYGLDGIMIGRGIFHDPYAFAENLPGKISQKKNVSSLYKHGMLSYSRQPGKRASAPSIRSISSARYISMASTAPRRCAKYSWLRPASAGRTVLRDVQHRSSRPRNRPGRIRDFDRHPGVRHHRVDHPARLVVGHAPLRVNKRQALRGVPVLSSFKR
jgi:hypothetical protein